METLFYILVVLACIASILNTVVLFFVVLFLVNQRDKTAEFRSDLVQLISGIEPTEPVVVQQDTRPKTWDEKYEDELVERERRMREEMGGGLVDLGRPTSNYGVAPAANPEAQEGLHMRTSQGNMMR